MTNGLNRREVMKGLVAATAGAALPVVSPAWAADSTPAAQAPLPAQAQSLPTGTIGNLKVSRILLGGNLLTHFTHSRDLQYVYSLAAQYNNEARILETLAVAETNGVNTLVIHTVPWCLDILQKHRKRGGKMQWIICTTAEIDDSMAAYTRSIQELADMGTDAVYLWGVRGDALSQQGRVDLIAKAVEIGKKHKLPSGVGAHDVNVVLQCQQNNIPADFYIKTFHSHNYPTAPRPEEIKGATAEIPGYWCADPQMVIDTMKDVQKPWIAFKVMAAGAIPPADAFQHAFGNGADHIIAGMFDFEIAADVGIANRILSGLKRTRPWRS